MYKNIISFLVCFLVLLNIPSIVQETQSIAISSPISYFTFFLLSVLIVTNKTKFPKQILFLAGIASLYYFIGAFQNEVSLKILLLEYFKFLLYLFGLFISLRYINHSTIILLLLAGAITILLDSLYFRFNDFQGIGFVSQYGRYSGFYLNPNSASVVCSIGYALTIVKINRWKTLAVVFTFMGFLTLSKTFMLVWILITIIYLFLNRKYIVKTIFIVVCAAYALITFSGALNLETNRLRLLTGMFSGSLDTGVVNHDGRQDLWSNFYERIANSPIIGNGYSGFMTTVEGTDLGVHNTFLLILGESGFLPFLLFLALFIWLLKRTFTSYINKTDNFLLTLVLITTLLVSHVFFSLGIQIFLFSFIIYKITQEEGYIKTI